MNKVNSPRLCILVYAQHLSGVGHYVRTYEIARELAKYHEVHWVEGGRAVPHRPCAELNIINLPTIQRDHDGNIVGDKPQLDTDEIFRARKQLLCEKVNKIQPDIFLIEYFPFSKWELGQELEPAITIARQHGSKIICSLRDVVKKTRFEKDPDTDYATRVCDRLDQYFDMILVHADPQITRLQEHFPDMDSISIPIYYTGLVSEKPLPLKQTEDEIKSTTDGRDYILVSTGGSSGGRKIILEAVSAWHNPELSDNYVLVIFSSLNQDEDFITSLQLNVGNLPITILPFCSDFLQWMQSAVLSISQAGYNTTANILETGVRALMIPNPDMSDQPYRANRLANMGLIEKLDIENLTTETLSLAITRSLARINPKHQINLDGAVVARELIETLETAEHTNPQEQATNAK